MHDRAYTVPEIDALRRAVENKWLFGKYNSFQYKGMSRSYNEIEKTQCVEEIVRTFMLVGKIAEDLYASEHNKS